MERDDYPTTYQLREHVVTCKPGFDDWCKRTDELVTELAELREAFQWYIRYKPEMQDIPIEGTHWTEVSEWEEELVKLYKARMEELCTK